MRKGDYHGGGRKGKWSFGGHKNGTTTTTRKSLPSSSSRREFQHEDFEERDVWEVANERENNFNSSSSSSCSSSSSSAWHFSGATSTPRVAIPPPARARSGQGNGRAVVGPTCGGNEVEDDDEEEEMVPPHEWLARKLAGSQISSFSVCEGIGRTLKGRDLSQVRNAILTKTGFLE